MTGKVDFRESAQPQDIVVKVYPIKADPETPEEQKKELDAMGRKELLEARVVLVRNYWWINKGHCTISIYMDHQIPILGG